LREASEDLWRGEGYMHFGIRKNLIEERCSTASQKFHKTTQGKITDTEKHFERTPKLPAAHSGDGA